MDKEIPELCIIYTVYGVPTSFSDGKPPVKIWKTLCSYEHE